MNNGIPYYSSVEQEVYIAVKYLPPVNTTANNITEWFSSTTPEPVRKRRDAGGMVM